jgi:cytochrome c peroxidase
MKNLLPLLTLAAIALTFAGCLPETVTEGPRAQDGYSNPLELRFNAQEFATLNESIDIDQNIAINMVEVPRHLQNSSGISTITPSESDARKALLGRVLFYDTQLSATGETSCNSCHLQEAAFSDTKAFSDGINGAITKRNSIALGSVPTFAPQVSGYGSSGDETSSAVEGRIRFFWDERAGTVKEQSEATIQDELEMGQDLHELSDELRSQEMYKILSMKAFGTTELTPDRITLALEKFTSSITSMNTRFDQLADAELFGSQNNGAFTQQELQGRQLFSQNCASCHGDNMAEPSENVANNGLDASYADKGVGEVTGAQWQNGMFKVPFLRNVALTGPYMHDGRFTTLRQVINHYSEGVADHPNLHSNLKDAFSDNPVRMNFSEGQKQALIAFLEMTTDETVLVASEFSDPFRQ